MTDPRYPPEPGQNEFALMVKAKPTWRENKQIGLQRLRTVLAAGVVRTTSIRELRAGEGWGFYFHGFRCPVWRSHG